MTTNQPKLLTTTCREANTWIEKKIQLKERISELIDFDEERGKKVRIVDYPQSRGDDTKAKSKEELHKLLKSL